MNPLVLRIAALLAAAAVGWVINGWRLGQQIVQAERDRAEAAEVASESARLKERAWNKQLEDARNEATKREIKLRADAAAARLSADGLRDDLAEFQRNLPDLTADAVRQYANTLADVFGACTDRYRGLAEEADGHVSDKQTLMGAWPQ